MTRLFALTLIAVLAVTVSVVAQETPEAVPAEFTALQKQVTELQQQLANQTKLFLQLQQQLTQVQQSVSKQSPEDQQQALAGNIEAGEQEIRQTCREKRARWLVLLGIVDGKLTRFVGCVD